MLQAKATEIPSRSALQFVVSALVLLGAFVTFCITRSDAVHRVAGLMPEVVSTSALPRLVMDEIVVRAPHPGRIVDAVAHLSGINQ